MKKLLSRTVLTAASLLSMLPLTSAQNAQVKVSFDWTFRTIAPPNDAFAQDASHVRVVSAILLALSLVFVLISLAESKRWSSTVPTALTLGAATCVLPEAVDNYLANCYWSQSHDPSQLMFTFLGREFDVYVGIIWWSFGAVLGCSIFGALMRGVSNKTLLVFLGLAGLFDVVLEECLLSYGGLYLYYGHQPLVLFSLFPCWWAFCNVSAVFLGIAMTYRYREWFNGWKSVFVLPILPFCYVAGWSLAAMPTVYAVHADYSPVVTQLCGILTCCLALLQIGVIMDVVLGRQVFESSHTSGRVIRFEEKTWSVKSRK
ncbi:hypothetical protein HER10_EVM0004190 [Colletotrichum scovillei]|uniref:Membrane protein n=1 Tax=Colletotrichum scovillei TaxID=1209932 RepID=A0A9P7QUU9_9PEZI|nr:uncharacterized protein HER10_EVM0004190 [Colletotrichum scovillei]KAF4774867.1 hypothetical protein HER10_EVM0004190 [Colletotrichum scovillei]KAG7042989.1 putative membrane protein [Colletotrichum scovillei]KAG7043583.1 putative membrane protein [Colletotrichum scovillei]KAG7063037.1 putative membrane protein [Colletotrichum scovillei]